MSHLQGSEKAIIIDAMKEVSYDADQMVITQGDVGDHLYLVESGRLECFKRDPVTDEKKHLKYYEKGGLFGELALLYNSPRLASIITLTPTVLWSLDRETFNHIVKDSAIKKRQQYENFLKRISILQTMDDYERM